MARKPTKAERDFLRMLLGRRPQPRNPWTTYPPGKDGTNTEKSNSFMIGKKKCDQVNHLKEIIEICRKARWITINDGIASITAAGKRAISRARTELGRTITIIIRQNEKEEFLLESNGRTTGPRPSYASLCFYILNKLDAVRDEAQQAKRPYNEIYEKFSKAHPMLCFTRKQLGCHTKSAFVSLCFRLRRDLLEKLGIPERETVNGGIKTTEDGTQLEINWEKIRFKDMTGRSLIEQSGAPDHTWSTEIDAAGTERLDEYIDADMDDAPYYD